MLNKVNIDKILNNLVKICWKNNIQYKIIFKNNEMFIMYLTGKKDSVLLAFSKEKMIFEETFEYFLTEILKYNAKKAIFITIGIFDSKIIKSPTLVVNRNIKLIDKYTFIRQQLGFNGNISDDLKENNLNFYRYLPIS